MTGSWWIRLILVLCLSHGGNTADVDETCEFLSQAVDHVKIERSTDRNGRLKLNKLELKVFYKEIVSSFDCLADIKLEMKVEGEEEWRKMDKWKRKKLDYFLWDLKNIVPCKSHDFRLRVGEKISPVKTLPRSTPAQMVENKFKVDDVTELRYENGNIVWTSVDCVTGYKMLLAEGPDRIGIKNWTQPEEIFNTSELGFCKEFTLYVTPYIESDNTSHQSRIDEDIEFTSNPNFDELKEMNFEISSSEENAKVIRWENTSQTFCVTHKVSLCPAGGQCSSSAAIYGESEFKLTDALQPNTTYTVRLSSELNDKIVYERVKSFRTAGDLSLVELDISSLESNTSHITYAMTRSGNSSQATTQSAGVGLQAKLKLVLIKIVVALYVIL